MFRKPKLALLDIDGVIADDRHRVKYALIRQWATYFRPELVEADKVWPQGRDLCQRLLRRGWQVGYLTGRREDLRATTTAWLETHGFPLDRAPLMRGFSESMPLANLKTKRLRELIEQGGYRKVVLFDDDPEVIRLVHQELGRKYAVHCTWHVKEKAMVKAATS